MIHIASWSRIRQIRRFIQRYIACHRACRQIIIVIVIRAIRIWSICRQIARVTLITINNFLWLYSTRGLLYICFCCDILILISWSLGLCTHFYPPHRYLPGNKCTNKQHKLAHNELTLRKIKFKKFQIVNCSGSLSQRKTQKLLNCWYFHCAYNMSDDLRELSSQFVLKEQSCNYINLSSQSN